MKKICSSLSLLFLLTQIQAQPSWNMTYLGTWFNPSEPTGPLGGKYIGVWGWKNANDGKEYAVIGATTGNYFVEVTNPSAPVLRDFVPGRNNSCGWREIKTYQNYAYLVSDDVNPNSFQIVDLSYLPDSVRIVYDSDALFSRCHTIYVDGNKLYGGYVRTISSGTYPMAVFSLANPQQPVLLRNLAQDYPSTVLVHDMFVRNDTVYASEGYDGLFIFKYDPVANNFSMMGSLTSWVQQGYNHSSWLTDDGRTLVFCDEVPANLPVKVLDVSNFGNLTVTDTFNPTPSAYPHNPYVIGNTRAVIAYYSDGIQVYDISNTSTAVRTGYFRDHPVTNQPISSWGAYPYLPSGIILVSDIDNGLLILNGSIALGMSNGSPDKMMSVYPNPAAEKLFIEFIPQSHDAYFEIYDATGKRMVKRQITGAKTEVFLKDFSAGLYILKLSDGENVHTKKFVRN